MISTIENPNRDLTKRCEVSISDLGVVGGIRDGRGKRYVFRNWRASHCTA